MTSTPLPQSCESEEAVIGAVLIDPDAYDAAAQYLTAQDFYTIRHRWMWETFAALKIAGSPIDFLTVCQALERGGRLEEMGGASYVTALLTQTPSSLHAEAYARQVKQYSIRREMIAAANKLATDAYNSAIETDNALVNLSREVNRLLTHTGGRGITDLAPILSAVYDAVQERAKQPSEIWGIPMGLPKLDKETGGQHPGEMTILAGEPGLGKTWLALGMAVEMSRHAPGAFFSLEMRKEAIARRLISGIGYIKARSMRTGYMTDEDWERLTKTIGDLETLPFYLDDTARDTTGLRADLLRLKREHRLQWFMVDYMQLLTDQGESDNERTKKIGRELKLICNDLDLAGVVINSVNKQGMDKSGSEAHAKSNMSGSGQVIHDADVVYFLTEYSPENGRTFVTDQEKKNMATLWCKKGREIENPRMRVTLVRKQNSPFWGEMEDK